jgi:hypothetical protein
MFSDIDRACFEDDLDETSNVLAREREAACSVQQRSKAIG